jgi:2'-5' RNA ligase
MSPYQVGDGGIALFLPAALAAEVNLWRRVYDPYLNTIEPHVTILYPPFLRTGEWPARRQAALDAIAKFPRFMLAFREVGCFTHPGRVMWLHPDDGDGSLFRIEAALRAAFADVFPPLPPKPGDLPFHPHATLGFFKDDESLSAAMARVQTAWQPGEFMVSALSYIALDENGRWTERDRLPLG